MHHLIYTSRATRLFTAADLVALLRQSQDANGRVGLTGLLVYHEGRFMQVLEGEQTAVTATYARIVRDPRHGSLYKLADKPVAARSFPAWSMAFQEVDAARFAQLKQVAGYLAPEQLDDESLASNPAANALLRQLCHLVLLPSH